MAAHIRRDGTHVDPAAPPPTPAAARLAVAAARAVAAGNRAPPTVLRSGGGLCAPLPLDTDPALTALGDDDPVAAALRRIPAVVMAHFALTRGGGRRLARFVGPPSPAGQGGDSTGAAGAYNSNSAPAAATAAEFAAGPDGMRREWNRAMCQCLGKS